MTSSPDTRALFPLGRRVERLIYGGILLIVLCFIETYSTTANRQLAEDRSTRAVSVLLDRLEKKQGDLALLFYSTPQLRQSSKSEREQAVDDTRRKLGLPTLAEMPRSAPSAEPQTYSDALGEIVAEIVRNGIAQQQDLEGYIDPKKSPDVLISAVQTQLQRLQSKPTSVWGIETPHLLQLQYAGLDYKFPFGFISGVLAIALAPLIVGWLGALYATRQRELVLISAIEDYKLAFPHILNLLPVVFSMTERLVTRPTPIKTQTITRKINQALLLLYRLLVILVLALPLVVGFSCSLSQLWAVVNSVSYLFYLGIFMVTVMCIQLLSLLLQEDIFLRGKQFYE